MRNNEKVPSLGQLFAIVHLKQGTPSSPESLSDDEYVPALCTHRPSLLPIGCSDEMSQGGPTCKPSGLP